jgi:hypothetical protein
MYTGSSSDTGWVDTIQTERLSKKMGLQSEREELVDLASATRAFLWSYMLHRGCFLNSTSHMPSIRVCQTLLRNVKVWLLAQK